MVEQDNICKASDSVTCNKYYLLLLSQVFYLAGITSAICLLTCEPTYVIKKKKQTESLLHFDFSLFFLVIYWSASNSSYIVYMLKIASR